MPLYTYPQSYDSRFGTEGQVYPSTVIAPYFLEDASSTGGPSSTNCYVTEFIADRSRTVSSFVFANTTAMVGGTLFRLGLYTVAADDSGTLVARTSGAIADANVTGIATIAFNTTGGFAASYAIAAGTRYGVGISQVGASTNVVIPRKSLQLTPAVGNAAFAFRRAGVVGGTNDCPTTFASNMSWGNQVFWIGLT